MIPSEIPLVFGVAFWVFSAYKFYCLMLLMIRNNLNLYSRMSIETSHRVFNTMFCNRSVTNFLSFFLCLLSALYFTRMERTWRIGYVVGKMWNWDV